MLIFKILLGGFFAFAKMPTHPADDPQFMYLPDGRHLSKIVSGDKPLALERGVGKAFCEAEQLAYDKLKKETKTDKSSLVQWAFMDLTNHKLIDQSADSNRKIYGASVGKLYVAATLSDQTNANLNDDQIQLFADMLVISSNTAWTTLQALIGNWNSDLGRSRIQDFTQRMGYERTRGFQGWWGTIHGNELVARELVEFLYDTYHARYSGAELVWKMMYTIRNGSTRGNKYLPDGLYVGAKTGVYDGASVDPETGASTNPDGSAYTVRVRNNVIVYNWNDREYGLAVMANNGLDESSALISGGLFREYVLKKRDRRRLFSRECR